MPELPEVETIRKDLNKLARGQRILRITALKPKMLKPSVQTVRRVVKGKVIKKVERRGKLLIFYLSGDYLLLIHLKMTGQIVWQPPSGKFLVGGHPIVGVSHVPNRFTHITIYFSSGARFYFSDVRQFGYFQVIKQKNLTQIESKFGPEPLSKSFTKEVLVQNLKNRARTTIKAALLDQKVVAGIGNIYADESLFLAKISPFKRVGLLSRKKLALLYQAIRQVLTRAIKARGTSFNSYVDARGAKGNYWDKRLVYGRAGELCRRCGDKIKKIRVAGRGTHYCPHCQK